MLLPNRFCRYDYVRRRVAVEYNRHTPERQTIVSTTVDRCIPGKRELTHPDTKFYGEIPIFVEATLHLKWDLVHYRIRSAQQPLRWFVSKRETVFGKDN